MWHSVLGAAVLLADQATKHWVRATLPVGASQPVIPGLVHFTHVQNPGAAFGLLRGYTPMLIAAALFALGLALAYRKMLARERPVLRAGYALGVAGAAGNLIDRLFWGHVTDFIDLRVWPVFNVADVSIVVGALLLGWGILSEPVEPAEKERPADG